MAAPASSPLSSAAEERQVLQRVLQAIESDDSALLQRIEKFCFSVADAFEKVGTNAAAAATTTIATTAREP